MYCKKSSKISKLCMMRMHGSHVKTMTKNARQDDIPSCQFSHKAGRHISQTTTICRSTKQVDEGSIPEPRSRSSSAIYILEIESSYVKLETKPPTPDPLTK